MSLHSRLPVIFTRYQTNRPPRAEIAVVSYLSDLALKKQVCEKWSIDDSRKRGFGGTALDIF